MNDLGRFALIWLTVLSLLAFILFAQDKFKARHGRWRISEAALWAVAILGGGVGATVGMRLFHHKTKKGFFHIGLPLLALLQIALAVDGSPGLSRLAAVRRASAPAARDRSLQAVACSPQP